MSYYEIIEILYPSCLKPIIDVIKQIDESVVDMDLCSIRKVDDEITIIIISKNDKCCPITIDLFKNKHKKILQITFGNDGRFIVEDILNNEIPGEIISEFRQFLELTIGERLTVVNGKVVKSAYKFMGKTSGELSKQPYRGYRRIIWPWEKRNIINNNYTPWI